MESGQIKAIEQQLDSMVLLLGADESILQRQMTQVSGWSIAEHLDHSARVCIAILGRVLKPEGAVKKPLSLIGRVVLILGYIPRGKGRSPEPMRAQKTPAAGIRTAIEETRALLRQIEATDFRPVSEPIVPHPVFGGLTAPQSLRFAWIHTHHHLKIVRDIEKTL